MVDTHWQLEDKKMEPERAHYHLAPRPVVILRMKKLTERTGLSRSTIYNKLDKKSAGYDPYFPKQVRLGPGAVGWLEYEIEDWLGKRASYRQGNSQAE